MDSLAIDPARAVALIADIASQSKRFTTSCGDGELVWHCWGSGPPLVLLHGGTGSWTHWTRNVLPLARSHTVWVPDMPGYGESSRPPQGSSIGAIAAIVSNGLERLLMAEQKFDLAGFSFGGLVAGHLTAARPQSVGTLVLVGAGGLGLRKGMTLPLVAWRHLKGAAERSAAHRHNLAGLMLSDSAKIDALALQIQSENAQRSRLNSGPFSRGETLLEPLARLQGRVRLRGIWGRDDATAAARLSEVEPILRRADSTAVLAVIEDAGHWVMFEQPDRFNAALLQAL